MKLSPSEWLLIFLVLMTNIYAFVLLYKEKKRINYYFFGFVFLIFVISYSTVVLDIKISGEKLSIQKTKTEIIQSKNEIKAVANSLVKISYIVADGSGRLGGMPKEYLNKINELQDSIRLYLDKDIASQVDSLMKVLRNQIKQK